jgi:hypothetical protein
MVNQMNCRYAGVKQSTLDLLNNNAYCHTTNFCGRLTIACKLKVSIHLKEKCFATIVGKPAGR